MTTRINLTVSEASLLARASNQTMAGRAALVGQEARRKVANRSARQRRQNGAETVSLPGDPAASASLKRKRKTSHSASYYKTYVPSPAANRIPGGEFLYITVVDSTWQSLVGNSAALGAYNSFWVQLREELPLAKIVLLKVSEDPGRSQYPDITGPPPFAQFVYPEGFLEDPRAYVIPIGRGPGSSVNWYSEMQKKGILRGISRIRLSIRNDKNDQFTGAMGISDIYTGLVNFIDTINKSPIKFLLSSPDSAYDFETFRDGILWPLRHVEYKAMVDELGADKWKPGLAMDYGGQFQRRNELAQLITGQPTQFCDFEDWQRSLLSSVGLDWPWPFTCTTWLLAP